MNPKIFFFHTFISLLSILEFFGTPNSEHKALYLLFAISLFSFYFYFFTCLTELLDDTKHIRIVYTAGFLYIIFQTFISILFPFPENSWDNLMALNLEQLNLVLSNILRPLVTIVYYVMDAGINLIIFTSLILYLNYKVIYDKTKRNIVTSIVFSFFLIRLSSIFIDYHWMIITFLKGIKFSLYQLVTFLFFKRKLKI